MNKKLLYSSIIGTILLISFVYAMVLYSSIPADITVNEALSTTTLSVSLSGFPGEGLTRTIDIHNAGSVRLSTNLSWVEDTNTNGVQYTTDMPKLQQINPGNNSIVVTWNLTSGTPVGTFNGTISLTRV